MSEDANEEGHREAVYPQKASLTHHPTVALTYSFSSESAVDEIVLDPPPSRNELLRDKVLATLRGNVFRWIAILAAILVVVDGALFFFLLIGAHGMCDSPSRRDCDPRNYWYNFSIQFLNVNISYLAIVSLPWKLAHAVHLSCSSRSCEVGLDLYGRPTEEVWYHVSPAKRRVIVAFFVVNSFAQYANQTARIIYSTYDLQSTFPGNLFTSVFFFTSFTCAIIAGIKELHEEAAVRKQHPNRFPPGPIAVIKRYFHNVMGSLQEEEMGGTRTTDHDMEDDIGSEHDLEDEIPFPEREEQERKRCLKGLRKWARADRTSLELWGL